HPLDRSQEPTVAPAQCAPLPPPTKVRNGPLAWQPSTTTRSTLNAPSATRCTTNAAFTVPGGACQTKLPGAPAGYPGTMAGPPGVPPAASGISTWAFRAGPDCTWLSASTQLPAFVCAVTVTRSRPARDGS